MNKTRYSATEFGRNKPMNFRPSGTLSICFNILFFLQTQFSEEQFSGSCLSGSSLCIGVIAIIASSCGISDRFPVEHVHTPGGQASSAVWDSFTVSSGMSTDVLEISDRFSEEQVQTAGGQTSFSAPKALDSLSWLV